MKFECNKSISVCPISCFCRVGRITTSVRCTLANRDYVSRRASLVQDALPQGGCCYVCPIRVGTKAVSDVSNLSGVTRLRGVICLTAAGCLRSQVRSSKSFSRIFTLIRFIYGAARRYVRAVSQVRRVLIIFSRRKGGVIGQVLSIKGVVFW